MSKLLATFSVLFLAACPLQKGVSYSGPGDASRPTTTSSPTEYSTQPNDDERNRQAEEHGRQGQSSLDQKNLLRHELESLAGLTLEAAKAKAKAMGHTGEIEVAEKRNFVEGCKPGLVCEATDAREGQSGMSNTQILVLWTNKTVTISGPPE